MGDRDRGLNKWTEKARQGDDRDLEYRLKEPITIEARRKGNKMDRTDAQKPDHNRDLNWKQLIMIVASIHDFNNSIFQKFDG